MIIYAIMSAHQSTTRIGCTQTPLRRELVPGWDTWVMDLELLCLLKLLYVYLLFPQFELGVGCDTDTVDYAWKGQSTVDW
jgi:hypothetical protein